MTVRPAKRKEIGVSVNTPVPHAASTSCIRIPVPLLTAASTFAVIPFAATMSNPSPAPTVLSADHTAVRRLRLLKDATPPCINLDGLTVLSSTVTEHSLQGSNGFFKGSYSWTEDTSFAVLVGPAHGQPRTKTESTFQSHILTVQTHRRVVEWYRPRSGGSEYHRWVHNRYRDAFVAWETFSFDTCSGEDETPWGIALLQN